MKKIRWIIGLISILVCHKGMAHPAFEGLRLGLQGGYAILDSTVNIAAPTSPAIADKSDVSGRGAIGGIFIDWVNLIEGDLWLGIEANLNLATAKGKKNTIGIPALVSNNNDFATALQFRRSYDISAKIGQMFGGAAVPYIKLGVSAAQLRASSVSNSYPAKGSISGKFIGMLVGAGAEFPLSDRLSLSAEYNYRSFSTLTPSLKSVTEQTIRTVSIAPSSSTIMVRLTYRISGSDFSPTPPPKKVKRNQKPRKRRPPPPPAPAPASSPAGASEE